LAGLSSRTPSGGGLCADPVQRHVPGDRITQKGLTLLGPLQMPGLSDSKIRERRRDLPRISFHSIGGMAFPPGEGGGDVDLSVVGANCADSCGLFANRRSKPDDGVIRKGPDVAFEFWRGSEPKNTSSGTVRRP